MPQLSFLWNRILRETGEIPEIIPQQTLEDLILTKDFKRDTLSMLRKPCTGDEIRLRQTIIDLAVKDSEFCRLMENIQEHLRQLNNIWGFYSRAESDEERILLFPPVMKHYFAMTDVMTELEKYVGRLHEIGSYYRKLRKTEKFLESERRCSEMLRSRRSGMILSVNGSNVRAHDNRDSLREKLENTFRRMDLSDAIPTEKHPTRATPSIVKGYSEVYSSYFECARAYLLWNRTVFPEAEEEIQDTCFSINEIAFILEIGSYFRNLKEMGYPLLMPEVAKEREMVLTGLVDASLAKRGIRGEEVVPNDVHMEDKGRERLNFYILSGANGGGKTTYLRACTVAALFFTTGCPVTAETGRMMAFDNIFTHFPANESFESDGRFVNETARAEEITKQATKNSFAVFNETFSGTDEKKSEEYSSELAETMAGRGSFGIYVTHIHSLTGGKIPTLAAVIDETDDNRRTYKIRRVGATASSFAADILEKYGLDAGSLAKKQKMNGGAE